MDWAYAHILVLVAGHRNATQFASDKKDIIGWCNWKTLGTAEFRSSNAVFSVLPLCISLLFCLSLSSGFSVLDSLLGGIIGYHGKDRW